jgi:hypothetical protein
MSRNREQLIIDELKNGSSDVLLYLTQRYFQSSRRWLRTKGIRDADTPDVFSSALLDMMREIQERKPVVQLDIQKYLFSKIKEGVSNYKARMAATTALDMNSIQRIAERCFSALDEQAQKVLSAYYSDNFSYEELAVHLAYSNPAIAENEVNRQMNRFEGIVKAAMEN